MKFRNFFMVLEVVFGRESFNQLSEIIKNEIEYHGRKAILSQKEHPL